MLGTVVFSVLFCLWINVGGSECCNCSDLETLKSVIDRQDTIINELKAKTDRQETINMELKSDIEALKEIKTNMKRQIPESVSFTAYLDHSLTVNPGNVVKFNQIIYNKGDAYNLHTGIFTVPVDGTYLFSFHVEHYVSQKLTVHLMVDGVLQVSAIVEAKEHPQSLQSGNTAIFGLHAGQTVWVEISKGSSLFGDIAYHGTVFTGTLLMN